MESLARSSSEAGRYRTDALMISTDFTNKHIGSDEIFEAHMIKMITLVFGFRLAIDSLGVMSNILSYEMHWGEIRVFLVASSMCFFVFPWFTLWIPVLPMETSPTCRSETSLISSGFSPSIQPSASKLVRNIQGLPDLRFVAAKVKPPKKNRYRCFHETGH